LTTNQTLTDLLTVHPAQLEADPLAQHFAQVGSDLCAALRWESQLFAGMEQMVPGLVNIQKAIENGDL
jgi:hypothetical protein